jgi:hypothetical protein
MSKVPQGQALPQPDEALFRVAFAQREHVAELLKAALPQTLTRDVDFDMLRIEEHRIVDPRCGAAASILCSLLRMEEARPRTREGIMTWLAEAELTGRDLGSSRRPAARKRAQRAPRARRTSS